MRVNNKNKRYTFIMYNFIVHNIIYSYIDTQRESVAGKKKNYNQKRSVELMCIIYTCISISNMY